MPVTLVVASLFEIAEVVPERGVILDILDIGLLLLVESLIFLTEANQVARLLQGLLG